MSERVWKGAYNQRMGLPVMMKRDPTKNDMLVATILLPEDEAHPVADAIIAALSHPTPPSSEALGGSDKRLDLLESNLQIEKRRGGLVTPDIALHLIAEMKADQATIIDQAVEIDAREARLAAVDEHHPKAEIASLLEEAKVKRDELPGEKVMLDWESSDGVRYRLSRYRATQVSTTENGRSSDFNKASEMKPGTQETKAAEKEGEQ